MKKNIIWFIILVLSLSSHLSAQSKRQRNPMSDMYKDPYWQKRFVGDLAFLSDREPRITLEEKELLDEIKNLLPNRVGEAIELLEESITDISSAALDFIIGQLNLQIGNLQQAKVHMAEAARKYPNYLRAQRTLGLINVRQEDYDRAVKHLTKSISLGDMEGRTYGLLGYCFQAQGIPMAAEKAYGIAVITEPDNDDWKNGLARNLLDQDKFLESYVLFEKLIYKDPGNADNWVLQANSLIGLNRIDEAAANIELITRMGLAQSDSMHLLGDIYLMKNMYEPARKAYLASLDKGSDNSIEGPLQVADSLIQSGAIDDAAPLVNKLRSVYRGKTTDDEELTLLTMQSQIAIAQGNGEKARATLGKITDRDPLRGRALITLGEYYGDNANVEQAILMFERAEQLDDFRAEALVAHARLMVVEKSWSDATELLRDAQSTYNKDSVQEFLEQVERIRRAAATNF